MTTSHQRHPELWTLLRGELDNAAVIEAGEHLDDCAECRRALAQTVVGHALVYRASSTLSDHPQRRRRHDVEASDPAPLPPLARPARHSPGRVAAALLATAATVTAFGWVGLQLAGRGDAEQPAAATVTVTQRVTAQPTTDESATQEESARLQPVEGNGAGEVFMAAHGATARMRIETHNLPPLERGQFYYVWLLDPATNKMLPLGQVSPRGTASFEVSLELLRAYSAVDVSLENDDGDPQHSPRSVLRAVYA